ncbi:MAG: class I SAM-dependent methyltransferase [Candidatus Electrothrix sp. AUS1_2]|nr:class I SAM-dependent methyltransferase [Candidatus Electrothrix sp. AUS1_2]
MIFNNRYYSPYSLSLNVIRKIGRHFFTPKVFALFKIIQKLPKQARVLDVGAGTGGFLQIMEQANQCIETFGIDIGTPPNFMSKGIFIRGDIFHLPFQDNSFDLITCSHVIEHLSDSFHAVAELKRICKPNGYIYVETPSHRSILMPIGVNFWDDPTHIRPYSRISLRKLFETQNLDIIKDGVKRSFAGIFFGFPYMIIGKFLKDPMSRVIFPIYFFGLSVYILGKKSPIIEEKI